MQDAKTGGSRWVPDIREDEITEFQEQNGDETATYKAVNVHPIISRVLDKLAFFRTHVSAVWYNKLANKTVKDKLDEIDTSINSLNSRPKISAGTIEPNENQSFTGSIVVVICYVNDTYYKIFGFRPGVVTTLAGDTSQITATAYGNTYTISSSVVNTSVRYIAFTI